MEDQFYDYPDRPVPADKRRTQLNIAVVDYWHGRCHVNLVYRVRRLAEVMSYKDGVISILAGCAILLVIATLTGNIGRIMAFLHPCWRDIPLEEKDRIS